CAFLLCTLSCGCWSSTPTPQPASPPSAFNAELARLIAGGRYQSAATQIDLRLQQNPNDTSLLITAADVAMRRDRLDDADRYFAAYADAGGSIDESIFMRWVTVATRSGNVLPFTRRMRRLLSTDVEAASATSVVFESDPTSPQVALSVRPATRALFARLLTSIGDIHSANQQRRQLLRESDPRQTPVSSADLIPLIAHMQRYMGPDDQRMIDLAKRGHPDELRLRLGDAVDAWNAGDETGSLKICYPIAMTHPDDEAAVGLSAVLMANSGDDAALIDLLDKHAAATITQNDGQEPTSLHPILWYAHGVLYQSANQPAPAAACYARSIRSGAVLRSASMRLTQCAGQIFAEQPSLISADDLSAARSYADAVQRLRLLARRLTAGNRISQSTAFDIAEQLMWMNRPDESKHWAATAFRATYEPAENPTQRYQTILAIKDHDAEIADTCLDRFAMLGSQPSTNSSNATPAAQRSYTMQLCDIDGLRSQLSQRRIRGTTDGDPTESADRNQSPGNPLVMRSSAAQLGINFQYDHGESDLVPGKWLHHTLGGGLAMRDFDLDGCPDVFLVQSGGWPSAIQAGPLDVSAVAGDRSDRFYQNVGGSFIQRDCGISDDAYGCGVAIGDVNADGFPDLLVCNLGTNGLWLNNG
ncbi:MAG: VCBS repeat-containing protein, partial [Planctomycetota bacterium]